MTWLPHLLSAISSSLFGISGLQTPRDLWKTRTYFSPRVTQPLTTLPHLFIEGMNTGRHPVYQIQYLFHSFSVCYFGVVYVCLFSFIVVTFSLCNASEMINACTLRVQLMQKPASWHTAGRSSFSCQDGGRRYSSATVCSQLTFAC